MLAIFKVYVVDRTLININSRSVLFLQAIMKLAFQIALLATTILILQGAIGQTDDVFLSVRRGPEVETIQGRPGKQGAVGPEGPAGPIGPRGPPGNCTCDSTEVEQLNAQVQTLTGLSTLTE